MSGYIGVPIEVDPDDLTAQALDTLVANVPGFNPKEAHLEVNILEVAGRMHAETRALARDVPDTIFRYFGESLVNVIPVEAQRASALTTWTMQDNAGYTIDEGTLVAYRVTGDRLVTFETTQARTVAPGSTTALEVPIRALEPGAAANGLGPAGLELIDSLAFVVGVAATAPTSGGVDAETEDAYLGRLRDEMRLLTPRFVLAEDAAVLARRIRGVHRALGIDNYFPGINELQRVSVASATGGTFTLTFEGQVTAAIAATATAATVRAALEALSNIAPGDVTVTGGPLGTTAVDVEFTGALKASNRTQMTSTSSLTGTGAAVTITTPREGAAPSSNNEKMVSVAVVDVIGNALSAAVKAEVDAYLQDMREVNFIVHVIDPTYTGITVDFSVVAQAGFDLGDLGDRARAAVNAYLSPAVWAGGGDTPPTWRKSDNVVRYLEVAEVLNRVDGVDYVKTLTLNGASGDVALAGVAPLPSVTAVTGGAVSG